MNFVKMLALLGLIGLISLSMAAAAFAADPPSPPVFFWSTVVNNTDPIPEAPDRNFNSYNAPSVSENGVVVFRGRSRGGMESGPATHGIYIRNMATRGEIARILDRTAPVPAPNNIVPQTTFIETPAFPRIDKEWDTIVSRGNHGPVWEYGVEPDKTRVGTSGIYTNPYGELLTGAAKVGTSPGYEYLSVPDIEPAISFDVFPGAPCITDGATLVFKGNYTVDGDHDTGVFYRVLDDDEAETGGIMPVGLIANTTTTKIPGTDERFGSLSPPSAGNGLAVFAGFDNEEQPTKGGIYLAPISEKPPITPLVTIGSQVPGESPRGTFSHFGEGFSFDGNFVGFWGAWGDKTRTVRLYCPEEGNKDRIDYCNRTGDFEGVDEQGELKGDPDTICDDTGCYQEMEVPANQGIFIHDLHKGLTLTIAKTGRGFDEFLFWNYSGKVPGVGGGHHGEEGGEDDGEPVRWRSSAFIAVSEGRGESFQTVFKGSRGDIQGIYLGIGRGLDALTVVDTTMEGQILDPEAQDMTITEVGLEREGFRNGWLVINARMGTEGAEEDGMAGIYLGTSPILSR